VADVTVSTMDQMRNVSGKHTADFALLVHADIANLGRGKTNKRETRANVVKRLMKTLKSESVMLI